MTPPVIALERLTDGRHVARVEHPDTGAVLDARAARELALALLDAAAALDALDDDGADAPERG